MSKTYYVEREEYENAKQRNTISVFQVKGGKKYRSRIEKISMNTIYIDNTPIVLLVSPHSQNVRGLKIDILEVV